MHTRICFESISIMLQLEFRYFVMNTPILNRLPGRSKYDSLAEGVGVVVELELRVGHLHSM